MRKGDVFMKKSVGKNEFILLLAVLTFMALALSSCADPYGKTGDNENGRVGNDPKVSDSETKPPMPTDGVIGYWVTPQGNDAIYFDKDGTCIMYETFSADLYEEYWVYQWSYLNEDNIRFEAEIDGELLFEDEKFEIVGNVLHMYDDTTFVYYKESKPEICYYDTFLYNTDSIRYSYWYCDSEDADIYVHISDADICFFLMYGNQFSYVADEYVLKLDRADSDYARFTLSNGQEFILTVENDRLIIKNDSEMYGFTEISDAEFEVIREMYLNKDKIPLSTETDEMGSVIDENGNIITEDTDWNYEEYTEPATDY